MGIKISNKLGDLLERLVEQAIFRFRWIFVLLILIPINIVYESWFSLRDWLVYTLNSAPKAHDRKVAAIQKQVRTYKMIQ